MIANFLGIGIDAITYGQMYEKIDCWLEDKQTRSHHIACVNAYCATLARNNPRLTQIYNGADIVGADGMPFVWWIRRILGARCDRLAAPDILLKLAIRAKHTGYTFYLFGGAPEILKAMKTNLETKFPHLKIVGCMSPPFRPLSDDENRRTVDELNSLQPDIVCVGLGTPKQDYWIDEHLYKVRGSVMISSGATFDFFGGRIKMAPEFVRKSGFEWLYRLFSKDFCRLFKRYTVMNLIFLWFFSLQLIGLQRRSAGRWNRPDQLKSP